MGYFRDTVKGVSWSGALSLTIRAITVVRIAILARLLTPSQFGIFGIATIVLALLEVLLETGVNVFLIQAKTDIKKYIDSAWIVSIGRGIIMSIILISTAPLVANFFKSPAAVGVLVLIGFTPFLRGFINPSIVYFQKDIKFHKQFWYQVFLFLVDTAVTVSVTLATRSVYGLVIGLLAGVIAEIIISFIFATPRPKFNFDPEYLKLIFHRGKWVTLFGIFGYLAQEGDTIAVGRLTNTASLGKYDMAYTIATIPIDASDVVNQVVFPVYVKIAHDTKRLARAFFKTTILLTLGTFCVSVFIYLFTYQIIQIFLGNQWLSIIPILRLLSIYGILRAIFGSASALFLSVEKQEYVTLMTFFRVAGLVITIVPAILYFGLVGAAYSVIFSVLIEIPVIVWLVWRVFSVHKLSPEQRQ